MDFAKEIRRLKLIIAGVALLGSIISATLYGKIEDLQRELHPEIEEAHEKYLEEKFGE